MKDTKRTKTCPRCGTEKSIDNFGCDRRNLDGHDTYCRLCRRDIWRKPRGGVARLLLKFTDAELLDELQRRNAIAAKLDELGHLVAPEYADEDELSSADGLINVNNESE